MLRTTRRRLLDSMAVAPLAAAVPARLPIRKAVQFNMLRESIAVLDRFQLARDASDWLPFRSSTPLPHNRNDGCLNSIQVLRLRVMADLECWRGKWALVTGASSGIGWALAEELAAGGTHLLLTARRKQRLTKLRRELRSTYGVQIEVLAADLAEPGGPQEVFAFTE